MTAFWVTTITALIYYWMLLAYFKHDTATYWSIKEKTLGVISKHIWLCYSSPDFAAKLPRQIIEDIGVLKKRKERLEKSTFPSAEGESLLTIGKIGYFAFPFYPPAIVGKMNKWNTYSVFLYIILAAAVACGILIIVEKVKGSIPLHSNLQQTVNNFNSEFKAYEEINVEKDISSLEIKHCRLWDVIRWFEEITNIYDIRNCLIKVLGGAIFFIGSALLFM